jgi:cytochrome P450
MATDDDPFLAVRDGARHRALAELAARGPVHHLRLATGADAWVVTGYAEAKAVLTDPRVIREGASNSPYGEEMPAALFSALNSHMLAIDPPEHTRLRRLVSAAFTRRSVDELAPRIERICADLLDAMAKKLDADGEVDLIDAFAAPLPITVICELLGVPRESHGDVRGWAGPLLAGRFVGYEVFSRAAGEFVDFLHALLADKRRQPADDLLSALIEVRDGGDRLSEDELTSMVHLLLLAGHETTVNLIANGMLTLLRHPETLERLRHEPELIYGTVEELLRYEPPVHFPATRVALDDITIGDTTIPRGAPIVLALAAGNRDPDYVHAPERFDPCREANQHLGFGGGIHYCFGAPLARLETQIALGELARRLRNPRLVTDPPPYRPSSSLRGPRRLVVDFDGVSLAR